MRSVIAITTLLAAGVLAAPPSSPANAITEIQTGADMQSMMEPVEIMMIKDCMEYNHDPDFKADYSHQSEGKATFTHLPAVCCEVIKKAVKKHGWFPEFGQIEFGGGGEKCTEVRLTDVPEAKFKILKKLTHSG